MKVLEWTVTGEQSGARLDHLLRREWGLSRRQLTRLKKQPGQVLVNGRDAWLSSRLMAGDHIVVAMAEHLDPAPPEPIALEIIYEDQDLLIANKPAGMVSHPTKGYTEGTLANALTWHWQQRGEERPARLVTRLDRETSGLVLAAKTAWSHYRLSQGKIYKQYLAITRGIPDPPQGEINQPIGRLPDLNKRGVDPEGKSALTKYAVIKIGKNMALVRLEPVTGRTHQLRIHMAWLGCPLLEDFMYGSREGLMDRTALHAETLAFIHPSTGQSLEFSAPMPEDMQALADTF